MAIRYHKVRMREIGVVWSTLDHTPCANIEFWEHIGQVLWYVELVTRVRAGLSLTTSSRQAKSPTEDKADENTHCPSRYTARVDSSTTRNTLFASRGSQLH
jgi:hypothetical protein